MELPSLDNWRAGRGRQQRGPKGQCEGGENERAGLMIFGMLPLLDRGRVRLCKGDDHAARWWMEFGQG